MPVNLKWQFRVNSGKMGEAYHGGAPSEVSFLNLNSVIGSTNVEKTKEVECG